MKLISLFTASFIPALFLILASYAECNELLVVIFFAISIGGHGFNSAGAAINLFDLGPNYVAPLNAIINSIATVIGINVLHLFSCLCLFYSLHPF